MLDIGQVGNEQVWVLGWLLFVATCFGIVYLVGRLIFAIRDPKNIPNGPAEGWAEWERKRRKPKKEGSK